MMYSKNKRLEFTKPKTQTNKNQKIGVKIVFNQKFGESFNLIVECLPLM